MNAAISVAKPLTNSDTKGLNTIGICVEGKATRFIQKTRLCKPDELLNKEDLPRCFKNLSEYFDHLPKETVILVCTRANLEELHHLFSRSKGRMFLEYTPEKGRPVFPSTEMSGQKGHHNYEPLLKHHISCENSASEASKISAHFHALTKKQQKKLVTLETTASSWTLSKHAVKITQFQAQ